MARPIPRSRRPPRNFDGIVCVGDAYVEHIESGGRDIIVTSVTGPHHTIIDGGGVGRVVTFQNNERATAELSGFHDS